ncbi:carboxypeptidase-like regulatory domain-containing protein [Bacteroidota bacterium]
MKNLLSSIITAVFILSRTFAGTGPAIEPSPVSASNTPTKPGSEFTQTISGMVLDAVTDFPLIGANIILMNSEPLVGTVTDLNGNFTLPDIPVGRQSLEISYVGYHKKIIPNILLVSGKQVMLQVFLEEQAIQVEEVTVKAGRRKDQAINEMATVSARTFSVEETERFAGSLGDPARMVANYAGVSTQNDSRNDIIIRGNSPIGVLWRMEGIEIPNPNHFGALGTTGGPVSMVNNNLLANSDFLTGAFPAEFGNATAGAFDLNMRSGNRQKTEFTGQIGFNGFEGGVEGPLFTLSNGQKASYLANFRYSTLDVMHKLGFSFGTGSAVPQYKDLTFMVDIPGSKLGRLKLFGILGDSYIELGRETDDSTANNYSTKGTATNFGSGLGVLGASHTYYFNEKTRIKSTLSWQKTRSSTILDSLNKELAIPFLRSWQKESKLSFSTQFKQKIDARNNYSFGLIADQFNIDYIDSLNHPVYGDFITRANVRGDMMMLRAYGQYQHKFGEKFTGYIGLHTQYFGLNNEVALEPRAGLKWQFLPNQSFNLGFGVHSQIQPKVVYYAETYDSVSGSYHRTNEDLGYTRSNHYVLGYDRMMNDNFRIRLETYYQHLYKIPVKESFPEFSMVNAGDFFAIPMEDSLENKGTGRNYGIELTVEKFLSNGYYFLFTASVFDSKYKGGDGVMRNTAFNGNYVFNLLGGYERKLGENLLLTLDLKTVLAGGRRYVPIDLEKSIQEGNEERDWNQAYEKKYDDYFRTDFRIGLKVNGKRASQEWAIDLQNITGFQSVFMEGYDAAKMEIYTVYQQGFIPMFLYRIQF